MSLDGIGPGTVVAHVDIRGTEERVVRRATITRETARTWEDSLGYTWSRRTGRLLPAYIGGMRIEAMT